MVYDEELAQQPGVFVSADQISSLAVVAVSGLIAEVGSPHISPYLTHISPYLELQRCAATAQISPYLPISPPDLPISRAAAVCGDSLDLPISPPDLTISRAAGERVRQGARRKRRPETAQRDSAAVPAADSGPLSPGRPTPPPHTSPCLPRRCQPPIPAGKQQELSRMTARPSPMSDSPPIAMRGDTGR